MTATPPMPPTPVLETARLVLRPIRPDDAPTIQRRFDQWDVVKHLNGAVPWPYPADGAATNMIDAQDALARGKKSIWVLTLKGGDDELIGRIDLWPDDSKSREQRGFWLDPEFWGRGLMSEAADRVTAYAFEDLGWPQLWLRNSEANPASHRIKQKQGARIVDRERKRFVSGESMSVVWLLTREAWMAAREGRS